MKIARHSLFIVVLAACACANVPEATAVPRLTFAQMAPLAINIAMVDIRDDGAAMRETPSDFIVDPADALGVYLRRRFAAAGTDGRLRAVIEEASVVHTYKPSPNSVGKFLEVAGVDEYAVKIRLRLEHVGADGRGIYSNVLKVERGISVSEHASVAEREKKQLEGLEILFQDLDRAAARIVMTDMRLGL